MRTIAGLVIVAVLAGLAGAFWTQGPAPEPAPPGPLLQPRGVAALGVLEPLGKILDLTAAGSDRVAEVHVVEGQEVAGGAVLVSLESRAVRAAERELIARRLEEAREALAAATALGEARIREAELRLAEVEDVQSLAIAAQEARVRRSLATVETKRRERERAAGLVEQRIGKQADLDQAELALRQASEDLAAARSELEHLRASRKAALAQARAADATARAGLTEARSRVRLGSLEAELRLAEVELERTLVRAPGPGKVLRLLARAGEGTHEGAPVLEFADPRTMCCRAEVYEADAGRVAVGARARISGPALAGELAGVVAQVGAVVRRHRLTSLDPAADSDTRVIEVRIDLEDDAVAARFLNLHVDVRILPDEAPPAASETPR